MAEQKERTISAIKRNDLIYDCAPVFDASNNIQWKFYPKIGNLGIKGWQRLVDFMESIGFLCEDNPQRFEGRFFPKEDGNQLDDSVYIMAVGACLCLGLPCVRKGREIIAEYF